MGLPLGFHPTGGQTHDCTQALTLLGNRRPDAVIADKGYDTDPILNTLAQRGIEAVIPPRSLRSTAKLRPHPLRPAQPHRTHLLPPQTVPPPQHTLR